MQRLARISHPLTELGTALPLPLNSRINNIGVIVMPTVSFIYVYIYTVCLSYRRYTVVPVVAVGISRGVCWVVCLLDRSGGALPHIVLVCHTMCHTSSSTLQPDWQPGSWLPPAPCHVSLNFCFISNAIACLTVCVCA